MGHGARVTVFIVMLAFAACTGDVAPEPSSTDQPSSSGDGSLVPDHATVVRVDAEDGTILSVLPTGGAPFVMVVASGYVWIQNFDDGTLTHVDPATDVATTVDVGEIAGIASDGEDVWVARDGNVVARLNGATGEEELTLHPADRQLFGLRSAGFIGVAGGSVWLTVPGEGRRPEELWRIDPGSGDVITRIPIGGEANPPYKDGRYLWVVTKANQALTRVDVRTNEAVHVDVDPFPWSVVAGGGAMWIGHHVRPSVKRLDPETLEYSVELPFERNPRGLAFGGGRIWVASEDGLYAIDPASNETARIVEFGPFPVDTGPIGIAYLGGDVWVSIE